jgi:hypothetical protein
MDVFPTTVLFHIFLYKIAGFANGKIDFRIRRPFPASAKPHAQKGAAGQGCQAAAVAHGGRQRFAYQLLKQKRSHLSLFVVIYILPFRMKFRKKIVGFQNNQNPTFQTRSNA